MFKMPVNLLLATNYRWLLRPIADQVSTDAIPVRPSATNGQFLAEIQKGEVIYE